jgi:predicted RNase H-like nuclease (RuvC/YqgF family)
MHLENQRQLAIQHQRLESLNREILRQIRELRNEVEELKQERASARSDGRGRRTFSRPRLGEFWRSSGE